MRYKILFLGETFRADAITWMNGLKEFGPFDIYTWELHRSGTGFAKLKRAAEAVLRLADLKRHIDTLQPHLIIAERITSYGFLGSLFHCYAPVVVAQQGITDIYPPNSWTVPIKVQLQRYALRYASLVHAWGEVMTHSMLAQGCDPAKILVLAKGIDLTKYVYNPDIVTGDKMRAIVTRSLAEDYRHETILQAFELVKKAGVQFQLTIVGDGPLKNELQRSAASKNIADEVVFTGRMPNTDLPQYLARHDLYLSMPCTEGVSASLFEAMATGCYPIVSDLPGNRAWISPGHNGQLVGVDDFRTLADKLAAYAQNRHQLVKARQKNRHTVEQKASYQKNMKQIAEMYLCLIKT